MDNEPDPAPSMQQGHTAPQYSHAGGHGQSLGHSVVPDLMKIYESLTQSKTPPAQQQGMGGSGEQQYQQPSMPVPQPPQQMYGNASHFYPPASAAAPYPFMQAHSQQFNYASHPSEMPAPQYHAPADYEDTKEQVSSSGRTLRKRAVDKVEDDRSSSDGSTSRSRKKKKSDGRWSKRFTWPDGLHRDFVSAIFDVGLKHASPSALLEHMPEHDQITSERVKSHLQKYRLHRDKSKKEFMSCYEASLGNFQTSGIQTKSLGSGDVAAHLAYSTMNEPEEAAPSAPMQSQGQPDMIQDSAHEMSGTSRGGALVFPKLTEAEKQSPIGASMGYMMGLFFALRQQLMANRAAAASATERTEGSPMNNQVPFVSYPSSTDAEQGDHDGQLHDQNVPLLPPPSGHSMDAPQQHASYQDQTNTAVASKPQASSSRTNLEESHLMKREMQNQMAFQNKMRALKQQELNKTKNTNNGADQHGHTADDDGGAQPAPQTDDRSRIKHDDETLKDGSGHEDDDGAYQETGEAAEAGNDHLGSAARARQRGLSMGASEEFWVNDEQLFEFLMNS